MKDHQMRPIKEQDEEQDQSTNDLSNLLTAEDKAFAESIARLSPDEAIEKINERCGIPEGKVLPLPGALPDQYRDEKLFEQYRINTEIWNRRKNHNPE